MDTRIILSLLPLICAPGLLADQYTLATDRALLRFNEYEWETGTQLWLSTRFETRSQSGQLFTLIGKDTGGEESAEAFVLTARVDKEKLYVDYLDSTSQATFSLNYDTKIANGLSHELEIEIDAQKSTVIARLDDKFERSTDFSSNPLDSTLVDIEAFFGKYADALSVTGCVEALTFESNRAPETLAVESQSDVEDGCQNACFKNPCLNAGICINSYSQAICDCQDTGYEGHDCSEAAAVATIGKGQFVTYTLTPAAEQHPNRIVVAFKPHEKLEESQVLLFANLGSTTGAYNGKLFVTLAGDTLKFEMTDKIPPVQFLDFDFYDGWWHTVVLKVDYEHQTMNISVDDAGKEPSWSMDSETEGKLIFGDKIYFGGSETEEYGASLHGCIKESYVNYISVIGAAKNADPAVSSNEEFRFDNCSPPDMGGGSWQETTSAPPPTTTTATEPEPEPETKKPTPVPSCDLKCQNGGSCFYNTKTNKATCICGLSGFTGPLCQFSTLPTSCDEAFHLGDTQGGVHVVDFDGNGPEERTFVQCEMYSKEKFGLTLIPHNMENSTSAREGSAFGDTVLPLTYRLVSERGMRALIQNSASCRQYVQYDCTHAPIELESKTWFKSAAYSKTFAKIGVKDGQCPCAESGSCTKVGTRSYSCNCDADSRALDTDQGWLLGKYAGVTSVTVLQHAEQGSGKLTMGPLMCTGEAGDDSSITFRREDANIKVKGWRGKFLKVWFRTSTGGLILHQESSGGRNLEASLINAHMVEYTFNLVGDEGAASSVRIVSQKRLNDSNWHRLLVEVKGDYIRFSVDQQNSYHQLPEGQKLDRNTFDGELSLGGRLGHYVGFVGCLRLLQVDEKLIDLHDVVLKSNPNFVERGCQNECYDDPCVNEAECAEDFVKKSYNCICKNSWIHSGRNCEIDVNQDSEVSFHNPTQAYIKYLGARENPLLNTMMFSFRTDQSSALLTFALDQFYNFVQVHLWDDNKISLTLNFDRSVYRCTVVADREDGDFNDMKWHQVLVVYQKDYTSLEVDHLMCAINGTHTLSTSYVNAWDQGNDLVTVIPPRPPVPPLEENLIPYQILYVGGVPKPRRLRRQVNSLYFTQLPALMGCMRGFKLADSVIDLRNSGQKSSAGDIRRGCETGCEMLSCEHGGSCRVNWPMPSPTATCACGKTSYFGPTCDQDNGLHFDGSDYLMFSMSRLRQRMLLPRDRPPESVYFAFSTDVGNRKQRLAHITFLRQLSLDVVIQEPGFLQFSFASPDTAPVSKKFYGNFTEGTRHFIFIKFKGTKMEITVDGMMLALHTGLLDVTMGDAEVLYFAGMPPVEKRHRRQVIDELANETISEAEIVELPKDHVYDYTGCISNAMVDFYLGDRYRFTPLSYYHDQSSEYYSLTKTEPIDAELPRGRCAAFALGAVIVPKPPSIEFPPWHVPFVRENYVPVSQKPTEDDDSGIGIIIGIIVVLVLVILLVLCFVCLVRKKKKGKGYTEAPPPPAETNGDHIRMTPVHAGQPPPKPTRADHANSSPDEKERLVDDEPPPPPPADPAPQTPETPYRPEGGIPVLPHGPPGLEQMPTHIELPPGTENLDAEDDARELSYQPNLQSPHAVRSTNSVASGDSYHTAKEPPDDFFPPPPSEAELASMTPGPTTVTFRPNTNNQFVYPDVDKPTRMARSYPAAGVGHSNSFRSKPPVARKPVFVPTPTTPPKEEARSDG